MAKEEHRGARRPQFLKLLTPGCFLKLEIPRSFIKYLDKSEHRKATLFSPLMGNFWHMSIVKEGCNMYLSSGWGSFAQAHNLEAGRFVLFRYEGNMVFTVKLFLSDGCLAEHGANNISPRRILLQEPIDVEDSSLDDAAGSKPKSILSYSRRKKTIACSSENGKSEMPKLSNSKGKQVVKEEAAQTSYTMWSKQLPQFERVITASNLSRGSVYFPRGITISDHLRNKSRIIATNYSGRKWPLRLRRDPTSRVITTGWRQFISDNGVELGDKFIFQFVSERVVRIQVQKKLQLQMIDSF